MGFHSRDFTRGLRLSGAFDGKPLFDGLPEKMSRVFERDCKAAGIPKHDGAGRVIDVHALRHTFGTMLARAGVPLQVAQRAMRHSTPALTANCYTHLGLMDISGAVNCLPSTGKIDAATGAVEPGETASK
jgi:integrase